MLIGGAEDKRRDKAILSRFVRFAGGTDASIVVISTASSLGDLATEMYQDVFEGLGVAAVKGLRPEDRDQADDPATAAAVADATGVFLTGGNQLRLSSAVGGTRLGSALFLAHDRGAVVAGTSAGASALASHMMAFGTSGPTPKNRMAQLSAGIGLLERIVIDQHFEQRGRIGRLLSVIAHSPSLLGLGLDEDTAAVVYADQVLEVVGRGAVTIVDGSHARTDAYQGKGHRPLMVSGVVLHSLPAGYWFDLRARKLLPGAVRGQEREASE
jgi:cyanophycinase